MKPETKVYIIVYSGLALAVVFAVLAGTFGLIYSAIVDSALVISEDNEAYYDAWVEAPSPLYIKFFVFNVTNPHLIVNYGAKPIVQEFGPYVYEEWGERENVEFYDDGEEVEYDDKTTYFFNREMSIGPETDEYTLLNLLYTLVASVGYDDETIVKVWPILDEFSNLFEVYSIGEFFFYGYDLLTFELEGPFGGTVNLTLYDILNNTVDDPDSIPGFVEENKFALLHASNATLGSKYMLNTGSEDMEYYQEVIEYNEQTELDYWDDYYCDMINGTLGSQYPPGVERADTLYLFVGELCRSLYATYEQDLRQHDEVMTYRFIIPAEVLADPNVYPDNECFCVKVYEEDEDCLGSGFLNLAPCAGGLPIVISTPHFYMGDPAELEQIIGLNPVKELHETYLDVEPFTGVVLNGQKRVQLNLPLRNYGNLSTFDGVRDCIMPIFWLEEGGAIDADDSESLQNILTVPFIIVYTLCATLMAVGVVMVVIGFNRNKQLKSDIDGLYDQESISSAGDKK